MQDGGNPLILHQGLKRNAVAEIGGNDREFRLAANREISSDNAATAARKRRRGGAPNEPIRAGDQDAIHC
jgi:hypothetical protein